RLVEGVDGGRAAHGPAEGDEAVAPQHQAPDVPVVPVLGVFEAEAALESEQPVLAVAQAQAVGMHGMVAPLIAYGDAGVAACFLGALGGGARRAPVRPAQHDGDEQDQEPGHGGGPSFMDMSMARTCLVSAPTET